MFALRELVEQMRNEVGQLTAREFAAQSRIAPGEPAADGGRYLLRIAEAQFRDALKRRAIVGILPEDQVRLR